MIGTSLPLRVEYVLANYSAAGPGEGVEVESNGLETGGHIGGVDGKAKGN